MPALIALAKQSRIDLAQLLAEEQKRLGEEKPPAPPHG